MHKKRRVPCGVEIVSSDFLTFQDNKTFHQNQITSSYSILCYIVSTNNSLPFCKNIYIKLPVPIHDIFTANITHNLTAIIYTCFKSTCFSHLCEMCFLRRPWKYCVCNNACGDDNISPIWVPECNQIKKFCWEVSSGLLEHDTEFWEQVGNSEFVERECEKCWYRIQHIKKREEEAAAEKAAREANGQANLQKEEVRANASFLESGSAISRARGNRYGIWCLGERKMSMAGWWKVWSSCRWISFCLHRTLKGTAWFGILRLFIKFGFGMSVDSL